MLNSADRTDGAERVLGEYSCGRFGPTLVITAGVHGNEPAGVLAARRVLDVLRDRSVPIHGRVVAYRGNVRALEERKRFIDADLNRMWPSAGPSGRDRREGGIAPTTDADRGDGGEVDREGEPAGSGDIHEVHEQLELQSTIADELAADRERLIFLDLHTTSAFGPPFSIIGDTLRNRKIAFALPIPVILGFEETIEGTLGGYLAEKGLVAVVVEGGQHGAEASIDNLESALWITLVAGGLARADDIPNLHMHRERLAVVGSGLPSVIEIIHRHGINGDRRFKMEDGYVNFRHVRTGDLLARGGMGDICSPRDGLLVMPNYQNVGDDGFFVGRPVRRFWLRLSTVLRRLHLDRRLWMLPGVSYDRRDPTVLYVDRRVARWFTIQIFHLFGFHRCRPVGDLLVFTRRPESPV